MNKLEELEKKYNKLEEMISNISAKIALIKLSEQNNKNNKRWRAKYGEKYYLVEEFEKKPLKVGRYTLENEGYNVEFEDTTDEFYYKTRNYFKTKEEAEEYREKIKTYYDLMDLADELNGNKEIDWNDKEQHKYNISYNVDEAKLYLNFDFFGKYKNLGEIYCLDENFLDIALERIGKDRLEKLFKER